MNKFKPGDKFTVLNKYDLNSNGIPIKSHGLFKVGDIITIIKIDNDMIELYPAYLKQDKSKPTSTNIWKSTFIYYVDTNAFKRVK